METCMYDRIFEVGEFKYARPICFYGASMVLLCRSNLGKISQNCNKLGHNFGPANCVRNLCSEDMFWVTEFTYAQYTLKLSTVSRVFHGHQILKKVTIALTSVIYKQDAQLSQRDRAAGCVIVFAKSRRLELGDNILRTL